MLKSVGAQNHGHEWWRSVAIRLPLNRLSIGLIVSQDLIKQQKKNYRLSITMDLLLCNILVFKRIQMLNAFQMT